MVYGGFHQRMLVVISSYLIQFVWKLLVNVCKIQKKYLRDVAGIMIEKEWNYCGNISDKHACIL